MTKGLETAEFIIYILVLIIIIGLIAIEIYIYATYGNMPTGEVPAWANWFMFGGRRKCLK